jgi:23S rRNA (uracil1939-C5)-methyltransferase
VQLKIEKPVYGGDGLARLPADEKGPGKSVFVPFALEGELVEAELVEQKPGFARAKLESVVTPSSARVVAECPYFGHCGGCQYQQSSYEHQLQMKAAVLRETLQRTGKIELPCELRIHPSPAWNYRNRTRLKVRTAPEFELGYHRFRSHDFLAVKQCPISSPLIDRAIKAITALGTGGHSGGELQELELFANQADDTLLVEAYCTSGIVQDDAVKLAEKLKASLQEIVGVTVFDATQASQPKYLGHAGDTHLSYQTEGINYRVSAGSFFQVNRFLIDLLVGLVTSGAVGKSALDLYAGVGLFSAVLARSFAQVIAVEASQTSFSDLRHNAPQEVRAVRATTEQFLDKESLRPDFVVVDPPRGGLGERNVRNLVKMNPARITYVSCDPSTLARDLRTFVGLGYRIEGADFIDLFPQTYHIESVFRLAP